MKLLFSLFLIFTIGLLFNFVNSINVKPSIKETPQYVSITPHGGYCSDINGQGYYLPISECVSINFDNYILEIQKENLIISKCNDSNMAFENEPIGIYSFDECIYSFNPFKYQFYYSVEITKGLSIPSESIQYQYYYDGGDSCTGNYYSIYYTNGFNNVYSKYECVNGVPSAYNCYVSGQCDKITYPSCSTGYGQPFSVTC